MEDADQTPQTSRPNNAAGSFETLSERLNALDRLTDAKFITMRTVVDSEAEKVALALNASEKAISKAEAATDRRFEGVNEFRAQLNDQAATFMPRAEADARLAAMTEKLETSTARISERVAALDKSLSSRLDLSQGKGFGVSSSYTYILAGIGAIGTIFTVIVLLKGA